MENYISEDGNFTIVIHTNKPAVESPKVRVLFETSESETDAKIKLLLPEIDF